jgi:hypothetical protein
MKSLPGLECLVVHLHLKDASQPSLTVACVYRPPSLSAPESQLFFERLGTLLAGLDSARCPVVLGGDLNQCLALPESEDLRLLLSAHGFRILNDAALPTHGSRAIDWLAVAGGAEPGSLHLLAPLERSATGHALLLCKIRLPASMRPSAPPPRRRLDWAKADLKHAKYLALYSPATAQPLPLLDRLPHDGPPDAMLGALTSELLLILRMAVPTKAVSSPAERPPWLSDHCLELCRRFHALHSDYRRQPRPCLLPKLRRLKAVKRAAIREAKRNWADAVIQDQADAKRLWDVHRKLAGKAQAGVPSFTLPDGELAISDHQKAAALADNFVRNFGPTDCDLPLRPAACPLTDLLSQAGALKLLRRLHARKATGPDGIPSKLLQALAPQLAAPVAALVSRCLVSQTVPEQWRRATVVPVPKKASPKALEDYRPIALLDGLSKVLERHLLTLLEPSLRPQAHQFAFTAKSGCGDALLAVQAAFLNFAQGAGASSVALVGIDCSKAFDKLPHKTVLETLAERGVAPHLTNLIHSWLRGRRQCVRVGDCLSPAYIAASGVPQGSILGPRLFTASLDALLDLSLPSNVRLFLYADDVLIVARTVTEEERASLQSAADDVVRKLGQLGMSINTAKSQLLHASLAPRPPPAPRLTLLGSPVEAKPLLRYLGVTFDSRLSFGPHWTTLTAHCKRALGALARLVHREPRALRHLFRERIVGLLLHSAPFCPPSTCAAYARLQSLGSYAARLVTNNWDWSAPKAALLLTAELPDLAELFLHAALLFFFDCLERDRRYGAWLQRRGPSQRHLRSSATTETGREVLAP